MISLTSPVRTRAHDLSAGAKLLALCAATYALFLIVNVWLLAAGFALSLGLYAAGGGVFFRSGMARLRVLWPFVAIVLVWHVVTGAQVEGAVIILRMVTAVALANLVTMTTTLSEMIDVVRWVLKPLRAIGVRTQAIEIAMAMAIRLVPVLLVKGRALIDAWRARSTRRANWRIVLPLTIVALDDADQLAQALKARGGLLPSQKD